jgi:hypothetical protein
MTGRKGAWRTGGPSYGTERIRKAALWRATPLSLLRSLASPLRLGSRDLRTSLRCSDVGPHGPLITDLLSRLQNIRGPFNVDDCSHFHLVLSMQTALGLHGDLLEIGSFHGRSAAVMARYLTGAESLHVCDAFNLIAPGHGGARRPSPGELLDNIRFVNPSLALQKVRVYQCLSEDLSLDPALRFRFIHIDGGHSAQQTLVDLNLSLNHLIDNGVIAVDDYHHPCCPDVAPAVDRFLKDEPVLSVLADLNRHGAGGRKIYLIKRGSRLNIR